MSVPDSQELDDLLDLGIATAFGRSRDGVEGSGSSGTLDLTVGHAAETLADLPSEVGRYAIEALIAQGGMGTVARARDRELDREVAIKFLRRSLSDNAAMLRLFREEARVMAQLQHPGIVPVHDVGTAGDHRLYYVMKLVDGESLRDALQRGRAQGIDGERSRALSIFARISDAIAFAHDRGFVHGDLKPANVMLGAFGEVQVLDWGFARSLRALSPVGPEAETAGPRALGTPAYMAPEQARGNADIDARTDVFGLGSILCEILTGAPPYRGDTREEVYLRASRAWLDEAHARLDASGADAELVALARRCLAPEPSARPASAAVVATAVNDHLVAVERRAQDAVAEAVAARARVAEERKARRMTVLLSVFVAAVLVAGMALLLWYEQREAGLRADAVQSVRAAQQRAAELRSRAQDSTIDKARLWGEATAVAREAVQLAQAPRVAPALLAEVRDAAEVIQHQARVQLRDQRVLALADEVRPHRGEDRAPAAVEADHRELLGLFGVDVDADPPELVAAAILESELAPRVAAALHHWAHQRRRTGAGDASRWQRLFDIADRVDPDPWRRELRHVCGAKDAGELRRLAGDPDLVTAAGSGLGMLGECLVAAGDRDDAVRVYRLAHLHRPDEYAVLHDLAVLLEGQPSPPREEITRLFTAGLALRPRDPHAIVDLAIALLEQRHTAPARVLVERARTLSPDYSRVWTALAAVCAQESDTTGELAALRELLRLQPASIKARLLLVSTLARTGNLLEARAIADEAVALAPQSAQALGMSGSLLMETGFLGEAIDVLQRAAELDDADSRLQYDLGLALQRVGRFEDAEVRYRRAIELRPEFAEAHCNLAIVLQHRGEFGGAIASLQTGERHGQRRPGWTYPTADWLAEIERQQAALPWLERIAAGEPLPADSDALIDLARAALARGDAVLAVRLFEAAYQNGRVVGIEVFEVVRAAARVVGAAEHAAAPTAQQRERASQLGLDLLRAALRPLDDNVDLRVINAAAARAHLSSWRLLPELVGLRQPGGAPVSAALRATWVEALDAVEQRYQALHDQ